MISNGWTREWEVKKGLNWPWHRGGDVEGGRGVAVKSFSYPVQFIVFCFYGRHVSLITSFFIQEYEWLTADKREIWKNGLGKMYNYIFQFRPAN